MLWCSFTRNNLELPEGRLHYRGITSGSGPGNVSSISCTLSVPRLTSCRTLKFRATWSSYENRSKKFLYLFALCMTALGPLLQALNCLIFPSASLHYFLLHFLWFLFLIYSISISHVFTRDTIVICVRANPPRGGELEPLGMSLPLTVYCVVNISASWFSVYCPLVICFWDIFVFYGFFNEIYSCTRHRVDFVLPHYFTYTCRINIYQKSRIFLYEHPVAPSLTVLNF